MKIISKNQVEELNTKPNSGLNKPRLGRGDTTGSNRFVKPNTTPQKRVSKATPIVIKVNSNSTVPPTVKARKKSKKKAESEELIQKRLEHLEREKHKRALKKQKKQAKKNKGKASETSPPKKASSDAKVKTTNNAKDKPKNTSAPRVPEVEISEPSYMAKSYDRFISLLRFNITFKLTLGYTFRVIFLIAFLFITSYMSFSYFLYYQTQGSLSKNDVYIQSLLQNGFAYDDTVVSHYIASEDLYFYFYDEQKELVYKNTDNIMNYDDAMAYFSFDFKSFPNFPTLYQSGKYIDASGVTSYFVLGKNMNKSRGTIEATLPIGIMLCFVLMISSILSSSKLAGKHLKPIKTMTDQVKDMSANNLSTRLNVSGTKDELKDLALTFNQMLDDIQKSYEREKQFVSDASHELRTPIAVIKGYAGMLNRWGKDDPAILEESIQAILGETENMHSLVESLLFIARNDKGTLKMDLAEFNLSDLIFEIAKETHLIDKQHDIVENIDKNLFIYGSCDKLKQALRIFVDNSIKYTPEEGEIKISLRATQNQYVIELSDNGIGISKEDLPHIFDRFYRADKSRTKLKDNQHGGTGLGLSIAKIIIEQHGGAIHVDSELNHGTTFTIMLPAMKSAIAED
ncbi:HAMP domain-containing sensor histidine kinase [Fusibacter ferrireducens]|uniref:histidine kinase n=1 Tax=Fusibacter ferrireducens TaxID=2785058 RepID=A0ABR9ZXZ4_9FIRM|nr:HAMP domain-containing sensor histidine kinase [Fusibacter ferrireducens]MBF4695337.1 HAMP domain-containing histidine kinase [Fusibacter ferrireducens]